MTPAQRQQAAEEAAALFAASLWFEQGIHFACYLPCADEFDSLPLIQTIHTANKLCYLPILSNDRYHHLDFALYKPGDPLTLNQYRILEPARTDIIPLEQLDIIIVPLIAFDSNGSRLGTGGGYYDRTFEFLRDKKHASRLIGLGYEKQHTTHLPAEPWDIPLNGAITEKTVYFFSSEQDKNKSLSC